MRHTLTLTALLYFLTFGPLLSEPLDVQRFPPVGYKLHSSIVHCVNISPTRHYGASGDETGNVVIWDLQKKNPVHMLQGHNKTVASVQFSPDERFLASGGYDGKIKIWDVPTGKILRTLDHKEKVMTVAFTPDSKFIAAGVYEDGVSLWELTSGNQVQTIVIPGERIQINGLQFSPDGQNLAIGASQDGVSIWSVEESRVLKRLEIENGYTQCLSYSPDGKHLLVGYLDGTSRIWDPSENEPVPVLLNKLATTPSSVAFISGGTQAVSCGGDGTVKGSLITDVEDIKFPVQESRDRDVLRVSCFRDGMVLCGGIGGILRYWDARTLEDFDMNQGHFRSILSLRSSPDRKSLVSLGYDGIRAWDKKTGEQLCFFPLDGEASVDFQFANDPATLIVVDRESRIQHFDLKAGKHLKTTILYEKTHEMFQQALSSDGDWLAIANVEEELIELWSLSEHKIVETFEAESPIGLSFSRDGRYLACTTSERNIVVWDVSDPDSPSILSGHKFIPKTLAFSNDSKSIVSGTGLASHESEVILWNLSSKIGRPIFTSTLRSIHSLAFTPKDDQIIINDLAIHLWDIAADVGKTIVPESSAFAKVILDDDGKSLLSADNRFPLIITLP